MSKTRIDMSPTEYFKFHSELTAKIAAAIIMGPQIVDDPPFGCSVADQAKDIVQRILTVCHDCVNLEYYQSPYPTVDSGEWRSEALELAKIQGRFQESETTD